MTGQKMGPNYPLLVFNIILRVYLITLTTVLGHWQALATPSRRCGQISRRLPVCRYIPTLQQGI